MPSPLDPRKDTYSEGRCAACGAYGSQHAPGCKNAGRGLADRIARMTGKPSHESGQDIRMPQAPHSEPRMTEYDANRKLNETAQRDALAKDLKAMFPNVPVQMELLDARAVERMSERISAYKAMLDLSPGNSKNISAVEGALMEEITASIQRGRSTRQERPVQPNA